MQSVRRVFGKVLSKLNLSALPHVKNLSPAQVKSYIEKNVFNICVLVVDAETLKDAYDNVPQRKDEYEELLKTAMDRAGKITYNYPYEKDQVSVVPILADKQLKYQS